ncbi:hypothetical protein M2281_002024 [Mesorhizobium soli]|uniref:hypothetical protein n=1 Tax=Pseudaminobacter soli (ex Li et al. 2025) TaxID=1295366 RepID=UPI002474E206|nr:hypothetical protein [Mesorhizobium soli]MDH6231452.1 hypothetical protein [Mesorhizobium soli]
MKQPRPNTNARIGAALALFPLLLAASCVSESNAGGAATTLATAAIKPAAPATAEFGAPQPAHATYNCGQRGSLTIDNFRTSVRLVDPEGDNVELPASPATQQSRYGEAPYALVLDGNEALYMKNGKEPVTCNR